MLSFRLMEEPPAPRKPFPFRHFVWALGLTGAAAAGIYLADQLFLAPNRRLQEQVARLEKEKQQLETYLKLLRHTERRARLEVLSRTAGPGGATLNKLRFTEVNPEGVPVSLPRDIELAGEEVYVDALVIKFEDHFVERGDPLKGKALLLFRRLFTGSLKPDEGYVLDRDGEPPEVYAARAASGAFERELWKRFWEVARDEKLARKHGVRAIHGEAVSQKLSAGKVYHLLLRSTGELTLSLPADMPR